VSGPKIHLGTHYPVRNSEDVDKILHAPVNHDGNGTSPWMWLRLANGDLVFGCFPQGDTYLNCEVAFTEDWQEAYRVGTAYQLTVPVSDVVVEDEDPAHPVFAPARGDEQWIGYARAEQAPTSVQFSDQEADQKLDWLLRAVTAEGADVNQRRYDLEAIAKIVTENPQAGYGRMPIDTDVHGTECVICKGVEDFSLNPPGLSRDGHQYVEEWTPVWVVSWVYWQGDEQGGGGHNWWPADIDYAHVSAEFRREVDNWKDSTAMVRLTRLSVPAYGTDEKAREAITRWIDADTDRIESGPEADVVVYSYNGADDWRIFLERLLMLKAQGIDCAADESAEIKAWLRTYPTDPLTERLVLAFPNELDEVGAEVRIKPEFEYLMTAVLRTWSGACREDFDEAGPEREYLRGQVELLLEAGAVDAPDGYDNADAKDWLTSHIITRVLLDNQKGNA
jgi:hypothetical protein